MSPFKWVATFMLSVSACLISFSVGISITPIPFFGFLFGHSILLGIMYKEKDYAQLTLNAVFIPIDIYAIIVRML